MWPHRVRMQGAAVVEHRPVTHQQGGRRGAHEQRLGAGVGAEVDPVERRVGGEHDRRGRRGDDPDGGQHEDGQAQSGPEQGGDGDQKQRPKNVVLLLDPERPRVLQRRRRGALREVVGLLSDEGPVGYPEERGDGVVAQRDGGFGREQFAGRDHREHHHDQGRKQSAGAPDPEVGEADPGGAPVFVEQQRGDQESAEHEEHVDAEEAT